MNNGKHNDDPTRAVLDLQQFRRHAHRFVDWMADYLATVEQRPVRSQVRPGELLARLPASCPDDGEPMDAIFADFRELILPGITHWQHPRFFAYFSANSSPPSVLAEMLTATLGAQCMLWETSPAANELETRTMEWLRELIGLPQAFTGSIQDSASSSTLCALVAARERATGGKVSRQGMGGAPNLVVYASAEAHSSIEKDAMIAGFGADNLRKIGVDDGSAMKVDELGDAIAADRAAGRVPACIVASLGSTGLGGVDPLPAIGALASRERLFLHVDAAWAGSALILPEYRQLLDGIEYVDSFVFNPHKWLFTNFDCSAFFLRDPRELSQAMTITPAYLESAAGRRMPEYRDWSIALGRRFRALKLWFVLRSFGARGLRAMLRNHIAWAAGLADRIRAAPDFELTSGPSFALLSFRYAPPGAATEEELERLNGELLARINDDGRIYLTKTRAGGRLVIRFNVGQTWTGRRHVEEAWSVIRELAHGLTLRQGP